jgi:hypothetical protein
MVLRREAKKLIAMNPVLPTWQLKGNQIAFFYPS